MRKVTAQIREDCRDELMKQAKENTVYCRIRNSRSIR